MRSRWLTRWWWAIALSWLLVCVFFLVLLMAAGLMKG